MESLFEYGSYRDYLKKRLGDGLRLGLKKKAAGALGVHTTLISQVLSGNCELSLEQTESMSHFLGHSDDEADYFLWLVLKERAGTSPLRRRLERQISAHKKKRLNLSERLKDRKKISESERERFYSTYLHGAIHVLASIPGIQTRAAIASALGVPQPKISEAVEFLIRIGVLKELHGRLSPGTQHIHLSSDSKHIVRHHLNWRLKAMEKIGEAADRDLHYSVAFSLSEADVVKIKEMLLNALSEISKVVSDSKEETAYVYCFDFFELASRPSMP